MIIPTFSNDLTETLDKMFPPKCPSINDSERKIWMYAGKRELIDFLIRKIESKQIQELTEVRTN